jgi:acyl-CoA dehydrogenase
VDVSIGFETDERVADIARRTAEFVRDVVIPEEQACDGNVHAGPEPLRRRLQDAARAAGVFAPHVGTEWGGLGLDLCGQAVVFEAAGYSLLGPLALNCAAPDEGNAHLLEVVASEEQKERYLRPLATGEVRSCFAMTEPAPTRVRSPRPRRRPRAAGASTAASGSSAAPTGRLSPSVWPAPAAAPATREARRCSSSTPATRA